MRSTYLIAAAALILPLGLVAQSTQRSNVTLTAELSGDNENPAVDSAASGSVTVQMDFEGAFDDDDAIFENNDDDDVFNDVADTVGDAFNDVVDGVADLFGGSDDDDDNPEFDQEGFDNNGRPIAGNRDNINKVTVRMSVNIRNASGLTFTGGHIHSGGPGENGPVVVNFQVPETTVGSDSADLSTTVMLTGEMEVDEALRIAGNPGNYYVNLHTTANASGEIRGQLTTSDSTTNRRLTRQLDDLQREVARSNRMVMQLRDSVNALQEQSNNDSDNIARIGRVLGLRTDASKVVPAGL